MNSLLIGEAHAERVSAEPSSHATLQQRCKHALQTHLVGPSAAVQHCTDVVVHVRQPHGGVDRREDSIPGGGGGVSGQETGNTECLSPCGQVLAVVQQ